MTYIGIYQLTPIVRQNVLISHQQDSKHDFKHALETTHCGSQHDGVITTPPRTIVEMEHVKYLIDTGPFVVNHCTLPKSVKNMHFKSPKL